MAITIITHTVGNLGAVPQKGGRWNPWGPMPRTWAGEGKADGTRPGSLLSQLACAPRPLFRSSLRASPFVTLSSPPHSKAAPRGSRTKHTEQGVTLFPLQPERRRQGWRIARDIQGLVLARGLANQMGKMHIVWSTESRGRRALALGPTSPLCVCTAGQLRVGFTFVNVWKKLKGGWRFMKILRDSNFSAEVKCYWDTATPTPLLIACGCSDAAKAELSDFKGLCGPQSPGCLLSSRFLERFADPWLTASG